jgi:hypothetical protein
VRPMFKNVCFETSVREVGCGRQDGTPLCCSNSWINEVTTR